MEISIQNKTGLKIKGKVGQVVLDSLVGPAKIGDFLIPGPGEYEVAGLTAIVLDLAPLAFHFRIDEINVLVIGQINRKLTSEEVESIGDVNILITDTKDTGDLVVALSPSYVVPFGLVPDTNTPLSPKLVTTKDKLPEMTTVYALG